MTSQLCAQASLTPFLTSNWTATNSAEHRDQEISAAGYEVQLDITVEVLRW